MKINTVMLGLRIRNARKEKNLTQDSLAEKTGLTGSYISMIENGKKDIGLKSLISISQVLDTPCDYLLFGQIHTDTDDSSLNSIIHAFRLEHSLADSISDCSEEDQALLLDLLLNMKQVLKQHSYISDQ